VHILFFVFFCSNFFTFLTADALQIMPYR